MIEESGGYLIKAKSPKWYSCLAGHALSARIGLERTGDTLAVAVGGARWLDKIIFWLFLIIPGFGLIIALPTAAVGTVKQLLLLKDIPREISKIIPIIESGGCLEYHRIPVFARGVEPFGFDNFMFRKCRKIVFDWDNDIFNSDGGEGNHYQPARHVLVLPYVGGIVFALCYFLSMFSQGCGFLGLIILLAVPVVNIFANRKNISVLHGRWKKICYPIFIWIVSLYFFMIIAFLCTWLLVLFITFILLSAMVSSWKSNDTQAGVQMIRSVKVTDCEGNETTLTREGNSDWRDDYGNRYSEDCEGNFRRVF